LKFYSEIVNRYKQMGAGPMSLFCFSDEQWSKIEPHPARKQSGSGPHDDRGILSGVTHLQKEGCRGKGCSPEYLPDHLDSTDVKIHRCASGERDHPRRPKQQDLCGGDFCRSRVFLLTARNAADRPVAEACVNLLPGSCPSLLLKSNHQKRPAHKQTYKRRIVVRGTLPIQRTSDASPCVKGELGRDFFTALYFVATLVS
jgi:hypothetical protein